MNPIRHVIVGALFAVLLVLFVAPTAQARADDHLKCYKIRDELKLKGIVDLDSSQFGLESGCKIGKAKLFCVPVTKTVIEAADAKTGPISLLPVFGPPAPGDRVCYKVKCPRPPTPIPGQEISDQFGNRNVGSFKTSLLCTPAITGPPPPSKLVFVTSATFDGNLGGLVGADAICQAAADNAVPPLPGIFRAWLSDNSGSSPSTRFTQATVAYQLRNGTTIANGWADLTDGSLTAPINVTENGGLPGGSTGVWTNTSTTGSAGLCCGASCSDWTSSIFDGFTGGNQGAWDLSFAGWTDTNAGVPCDSLRHLYCFEQ